MKKDLISSYLLKSLFYVNFILIFEIHHSPLYHQMYQLEEKMIKGMPINNAL